MAVSVEHGGGKTGKAYGNNVRNHQAKEVEGQLPLFRQGHKRANKPASDSTNGGDCKNSYEKGAED